MKNKVCFFLRLILALVFLFSGFVKSVEPMGTAIKLDDYFVSFNLESLSFLSPVISVLLPSVEMFLGVMLLMGLYKRVVAFVTVVFMSLFTLLTLWIYLFNPVSDCGCFGDALILSNGQTFYKNVVLLVFAVFVFKFSSKKEGRGAYKIWYSVVFAVFCLFNPIYAYVFHPAVEFLPYKIGVNINELISYKAEKQEPLMLYRNKQTLENKEFKLSDTEWHDTLKWEFVELIDNSKQKTLVSFDVIDENGNNIAESLLEKGDTVLFLTSKDVENLHGLEPQVINLIEEAGKMNYSTVFLTTLDIRDAKDYFLNMGLSLQVCNMDETMLKSFVRAEVGVVVVGDATILSKNNLKSMPKIQNEADFMGLFSAQSLKKTLYMIIYFTLLCVSLLLFCLSENKYEKR